MSTAFPGAIDSFTNITDPTNTTLQTEVGGRTHSEFHNDYNDAIEALETKVGIDGSLDANSLTKKIADLQSETVKKTGNESIGGNKTFTGTTTFIGPVIGFRMTGMAVFWPSLSIPTGWLLCDGSAVSRTTYAALFAIIGTSFGVGDGSTTFNLPPKGRVPVGYDASQTEFNAVGKTGGLKAVTLTSAQSGVPAHTHPDNRVVYTNLGGGNTTISIGTTGLNTPVSVQGANTAADAAQAHENLPPYVVFPMIIAT